MLIHTFETYWRADQELLCFREPRGTHKSLLTYSNRRLAMLGVRVVNRAVRGNVWRVGGVRSFSKMDMSAADLGKRPLSHCIC